MISPGLAACLTGAVVLLWSAGSGFAETSGGLRPMARPETLVVPALATSEEAVLTEISAVTTPVVEPEPQVAPAVAEGPTLGPATNLPVPRFVSLKTNEGNVRRGPSLSHRIDWVFTREDMPLQITAEYGHWRRVVDRDGLGGWVHYSLVSGTRTVIVDQDMLPLLTKPEEGASENARLEQGVIARLGECSIDWCGISAGGYRGWVLKTALWGVDADEIRE
jgi:SH3-like domain-containing protein